VVMATDVQSLFAALFTQDSGKQPAVVSSTAGAAPRGAQAPPGSTSEALQHYRRAMEALGKGDWRGFGVEMDALQKALQGSSK